LVKNFAHLFRRPQISVAYFRLELLLKLYVLIYKRLATMKSFIALLCVTAALAKCPESQICGEGQISCPTGPPGPDGCPAPTTCFSATSKY